MPRWVISVVVVVAAAMAATGTAGAAVPEGVSAEAAEPTSPLQRTPPLRRVTVGVIPIAPVAPLVLGARRHFFRDEGLAIEIKVSAAGGAANFAPVISGEIDIGFSDVVTQILALGRGIEIVGVAPANAGGSTARTTYYGVAVNANSDIRTASDLVGKRIAVPAINNLSYITIEEALRRRGVNPNQVNFVVIPLAQVPVALEQGRVDAAAMGEPFLSQARVRGARVVLYNYSDVIPRGALATYFTTRRFAQQNPQVIQRFRRAMNLSTQYAARNPREVRTIIPRFSNVSVEVSQRMVLPTYAPAQLGPEVIQQMTTHLLQRGLLRSRPNISVLIPPRIQPLPTTLVASVGPGNRISLTTPAGQVVRAIPGGTTYNIRVQDRSARHNFRLWGPGVNRATGVPFRGSQSWRVTFRKGATYHFRSDPQRATLRGSLRTP